MRFTDFAVDGVFETPASLALCKPLLKSVIDAIDVTALHAEDGTAVTSTAPKVPRYDYDYHQVQAYAGGGPHQGHQLSIRPGLLAECFTRCIQCGWDDLAMLLSFKIITKVDAIPTTEFHRLWVPFVRDLISALDAQKVPLSTPRYREVACAVLEAYLDKHVGKEPSGAVDYREKPIGCKCGDCSRLNQFLQSNERTWRFPAGKERRRHIESMLYAAGSSCTHKTEQRGSPHTLIVDKGIDAGTKAKKAWNDRFAQARDDITKIDQEQLKMLLGEEYEKLTSMRHLRFPGAQGPRAVGSERGSGSFRKATVKGVKRKAED